MTFINYLFEINGVLMATSDDTNFNLQDVKTTENNWTAQEPERGSLIFILGLMGILPLGPFSGIPAWVMGKSDLKKIDSGRIPYHERSRTKTGMILGMVSTIGYAFIILLELAIIFSLNATIQNKSMANREALLSDCITIGKDAQHYFNTSILSGGGSYSFEGFRIKPDLATTANGNYNLVNISANALTVIGIGKELGNDKTDNVKVEVMVSSIEITTKVIN
jgi:hypothetical protein